MNISHLLRSSSKPLQFPSKFSSNADFQKSIQVCILGANTRLGTFTSFLLKQNPLIARLHLQGCFPINSTGSDLNFFDTRCQVLSYCGLEQSVSKAIKSADVVLILPTDECRSDTPLGERIMKQGKRLYNIAVQCSIYAPRAVLVVAVPPVSVTTALVTQVFKKTNFYHPGRIVGSAALAQVKANTLMGRHNDLNPQNCYVPLSGGPDVDLAVPLFSKASPIEVMGGDAAKTLTAQFRGVKEDEFPRVLGNPNYLEDCALTESYALNHLIGTIALGICGDPLAFTNAYVRSKIIPTCNYMVSTVRFSRGGVVHNCGLPTLSKLELGLVERAALQLAEREQMADDYLRFVESKEHKPKLPAFLEKENQERDLLTQKVVR